MFTDPDLVSGDGIYSRYLTTYPFPGKYVFTITVTDNSNTAYVGNADIPLSQHKATGLFTRTLPGPVVDIAGVEGVTVLPPAKIGDLSAVYDNNTHLLLSWTTPGGDYNDGVVCGYHLLYSSSCDSLLLGQDSDSIVFYLRHKAGVRVEYTTNYTLLTGGVYVGLRAVDCAGNTGRISNLVYLNITTHTAMDHQNPGSYTRSENKMTVLGIVVGIILVITLSLLTSITCWFCRSRIPHKQELQHGFKTKSSGVNVDISSSTTSSDTISYKQNNNLLAPTLSQPLPGSADVTPTYWSASQLLADHENRTGGRHQHYHHQPDHLHHLHPPHNHGHLHQISNNSEEHYFDNDEYVDDYGSDLVDEVLEVSTSECKSDLNISDETSSTLPMLGMDLMHRNITQV